MCSDACQEGRVRAGRQCVQIRVLGFRLVTIHGVFVPPRGLA